MGHAVNCVLRNDSEGFGSTEFVLGDTSRHARRDVVCAVSRSGRPVLGPVRDRWEDPAVTFSAPVVDLTVVCAVELNVWHILATGGAQLLLRRACVDEMWFRGRIGVGVVCIESARGCSED